MAAPDPITEYYERQKRDRDRLRVAADRLVDRFLIWLATAEGARVDIAVPDPDERIVDAADLVFPPLTGEFAVLGGNETELDVTVVYENADVRRLVPYGGSFVPSGQDLTLPRVTFGVVTGDPIREIRVELVREEPVARFDEAGEEPAEPWFAEARRLHAAAGCKCPSRPWCVPHVRQSFSGFACEPHEHVDPEPPAASTSLRYLGRIVAHSHNAIAKTVVVRLATDKAPLAGSSVWIELEP